MTNRRLEEVTDRDTVEVLYIKSGKGYEAPGEMGGIEKGLGCLHERRWGGTTMKTMGPTMMKTLERHDNDENDGEARIRTMTKKMGRPKLTHS